MFKFTIRDLLWLTVVVALALGWFLTFSDLWGKLYGVRLELESAKGELERLRASQTTQIPLVEVAPGRYVGEFPTDQIPPPPQSSAPTSSPPKRWQAH